MPEGYFDKSIFVMLLLLLISMPFAEKTDTLKFFSLVIILIFPFVGLGKTSVATCDG